MRMNEERRRTIGEEVPAAKGHGAGGGGGTGGEWGGLVGTKGPVKTESNLEALGFLGLRFEAVLTIRGGLFWFFFAEEEFWILCSYMGEVNDKIVNCVLR